MSEAVVIVGSGLAGYNLARELRKADAEVSIVVVSQDQAGFYSKPMLSNALAGKKTATSLVMKPAEKMAEELRARILPQTQVIGIDTASQTITLSSGDSLPYRDLVLAVGAHQIHVPLAGDAAEAVISVNDLDDFARFAEALDAQPHGQAVQRVVILGAGLIGCEFANDLLARGIHATVIDPADRALSRLLPAQASQALQSKLSASGVQFHFGVTATALSHGEQALTLTLSDGSTIETDLVVSAIGLKPHTDLARGIEADVRRGVVVNRLLQTSVPHVYALGDCAEVDGHWLPYVMPLMQQARALAATLAGTPTQVNYPAMPVIVKTPAWPTVVCPPPHDAAGVWVVNATDEGLDARFVSSTDPERLLGFALQGKAVTQRQALVAQLPALLG